MREVKYEVEGVVGSVWRIEAAVDCRKFDACLKIFDTAERGKRGILCDVTPFDLKTADRDTFGEWKVDHD